MLKPMFLPIASLCSQLQLHSYSCLVISQEILLTRLNVNVNVNVNVEVYSLKSP